MNIGELRILLSITNEASKEFKKVTADSNEYKGVVKKLKDEIKKLEDNSANYKKKLKEIQDGTDETKKSTKNLVTEFKKLAVTMKGGVNKEAGALVTAFSRLSKVKQEASFSYFAKEMKANITDKAREASKVLETEFPNAARRGAGGINGLLKSFTQFRWLLVNIFLIISTLRTAWKLGEWANEVDKTMHKISAVTNESVGSIKNDMLEMRKASIFSLGEVGEAFFEVSKKGFDFKETSDIMNASMTLAVGGFTDLKTAASLTTQVIKVFQLSTKESMNVVNALNFVALNTAISIEEMASAFSYVAPIAKMAGISYQESAATLGLLTDSGLEASRASTSLRGVLNKLVNPSKEVEEIWKDAGVTFADTDGNVKTLSRSMRTLGSYLGTMGSEAEKLNFIMEMFGLRPAAGGAALLNIMEQETLAINELTAASIIFSSAEESAVKMMESRSARLTSALKDIGSEYLGVGEAIANVWTHMVMGVNAQEDYGKATFALKELLKEGKISIDEYKEAMKGSVRNQGLVIEKTEKIVKILEREAEVLNKEKETIGKTALSWDEFDKKLKELVDTEKEQIKTSDNVIDSNYEAQLVIAGLNLANQDYNNTLLTQIELEKLLKLAQEGKFKELQKEKELIEKRVVKREEEDRAPKALEEAQKDLQKELEGTEGKVQSLYTEFDELKTKYTEVAQAAVDSGVITEEQINNYTDLAESVLRAKEELIELAYAESVLETAQSNLSATQARWNPSIDENRDNIKGLEDDIKDLNTAIRDAEKHISTLSKQRFGGETAIIGLMDKLDIYIKKQKLADLGIGDAQAFLRDQVNRSTESMDDLIDKQEKIIDLSKEGKDVYKAWRESIETAIRSEVMAGEDLDKDVTSRVKTWQTALLGIQATQESKDKSPEEEYMNKLKLAYDVYYGDLHNQVQQFMQEEEDRTNGVATNVSSVIGSITAEKQAIADKSSEIDSLTTEMQDNEKEIETWQGYIDEARASVDLAKTAVAELREEIEKLPSKKEIETKIKTITAGEAAEIGNDTNTDIYNPWEVLFKQGNKKLGINPATGGYFSESPKDYYTGFANGGIVTSPTKAIVGEAGPEAIVPLRGGNSGMGSNFNITVNVGGSNADPDEIARAIRRELNSY